MIIEQLSSGHSRCILFFAGWGIDARPFEHIKSDGFDLFIAYDYRSLDADFQALERYDEVHLVAWSMGVWAASAALKNVAITSATAINGTEQPVNDEYGIPVKIAYGTLDTLTSETLLRFNRRMCASAEVLDVFNANVPQRGIEELKEELSAIYRQAEKNSETSIVWNRAVIGRGDRVFPVSNQECFWQKKGVEKLQIIDAPHYPFYLWNEWREIIV